MTVYRLVTKSVERLPQGTSSQAATDHQVKREIILMNCQRIRSQEEEVRPRKGNSSHPPALVGGGRVTTSARPARASYYLDRSSLAVQVGVVTGAAVGRAGSADMPAHARAETADLAASGRGSMLQARTIVPCTMYHAPCTMYVPHSRVSRWDAPSSVDSHSQPATAPHQHQLRQLQSMRQLPSHSQPCRSVLSPPAGLSGHCSPGLVS